MRLSAGRLSLSDEAQALCFVAGANSVFLGDRLLTTPNPTADVDRSLFERLGLRLQCRDAAADDRADLKVRPCETSADPSPV